MSVAQGRLLAVGPVRLLHRARRRQGASSAATCSVQKVAGATITTLEGLPDDRARADGLARSRRPARCSAASARPGILVRVAALLEKKGADLDRDTAARHLGAHLCRCTGYVKILDAVELLAKGETLELQPLGGVGTSGTPLPGLRSRARRQALRRRPPRSRACCTARSSSPTTRAPTCCASTRRAAAAVPGVVRVFTAADVPGELRVGLIHKDWPVFIPEGGRTSYLGDVLAFVVADDRETARARPRSSSRSSTGRCAPIADPVAALADAEDAVWELDGNVLSRSAYARGDVDAALGGERARRARGVPDPAHRARVPRAGVDARRARAGDGRLHDVLGRPGRVGRPRPGRVGARHRSAARSPPSWSRTAARSAARRTWRTRRRPRSPRSCSTRR